MECQFCNTPLQHKILDLGHSPLANAYLAKDELELPEAFYPLQLYVCTACCLVQVGTIANAAGIFNERYAYTSGTSVTWQKHCESYARKMIQDLRLNETGLVIELGSNDGTLLKYFANESIQTLGIDPAKTQSATAVESGLPILPDFFTKQLAVALKQKGYAPKLVIGNNVLAHVPDINDFIAGIAVLLSGYGICTLEFPHLLQLLANNEFDTIYHEHFFYFSLTAIHTICKKHGLNIFRVEELSIHGGSLRIYIQLCDQLRPVESSVTSMLEKEEKAGVRSTQLYDGLQLAAESIKKNFLTWLRAVQKEHKKIMAYGAAAKGNTFLNYCGVGSSDIQCIADITPKKQGLYLPGSHLEIVEEEYIQQYQPDYIIVLPWNFKQEINERLGFISQWGGKLVYFISSFEEVSP